MSIASDMIRGHTDTIILAHLLSGDSYGYKINRSIAEKTGGQYELKEATLYTAFRRLEQMGLITSYWGTRTPGPGGGTTPSPRRECRSTTVCWENGSSPSGLSRHL